MHGDPILTVDAAMYTLLTIQYNLHAGTLAKYAKTRRELRPILQKVLDFDVS